MWVALGVILCLPLVWFYVYVPRKLRRLRAQGVLADPVSPLGCFVLAAAGLAIVVTALIRAIVR